MDHDGQKGDTVGGDCLPRNPYPIVLLHNQGLLFPSPLRFTTTCAIPFHCISAPVSSFVHLKMPVWKCRIKTNHRDSHGPRRYLVEMGAKKDHISGAKGDLFTSASGGGCSCDCPSEEVTEIP